VRIGIKLPDQGIGRYEEYAPGGRNQKQTVNVPAYPGVLAIVGVGVLLLYGSKKG
jgi:hypothetical protein